MKMHDEVSLLTIFSQLKFDHTFGHTFDHTFTSSFLEFKFEHKFGCPFDEQACMQTFETFQNIFTPFKPNLSKTAQRSFTFD